VKAAIFITEAMFFRFVASAFAGLNKRVFAVIVPKADAENGSSGWLQPRPDGVLIWWSGKVLSSTRPS
jgi:hypothetical protein